MQPRIHLTPAEYLTLDAESDLRYEYWDGHVYAMAGAEPEHNQLKDNIARELGNRLLPRGCRVMTSDQRVAVGTRYLYPDVVVACNPEYADTKPRTLRNPDLIVEVISDSTAGHDRGAKLEAYTGLASLREYWIADPTQPLVQQHVRQGDAWLLRFIRGLDAAVASPMFDIAVPMRALYALVLGEGAA